MIEYRILPTQIDASFVGVTLNYADTLTRIEQLSGRESLADGRPFAAYILGQMGRTHPKTGKAQDRVYVATAPGSEGRAIHGMRGFIVERVTA